MKQISENLFRCGKSNTCYLRLRIPTAPLVAYPTENKEVVLSLGAGYLTPQHLNEFVEQMEESGLAVRTINGLLGKLKEIFKIIVGKQLLAFTLDELGLIFNSLVFTQHLRSSGQPGEAAYRTPLITLHTGARAEEIAGWQPQPSKV